MKKEKDFFLLIDDCSEPVATVLAIPTERAMEIALIAKQMAFDSFHSDPDPDKKNELKVLHELYGDCMNEYIFAIICYFKVIGHEEGHICERMKQESGDSGIFETNIKGSPEEANIIMLKKLQELHNNKTKPS